MIHWNRFPLLRVLIPFIAGISIAFYTGSSLHIPVAVFIFLTGFCGLFSLHGYKWVRYERRWIFGIAVTIFFLLCGYEITVERTAKFKEDFPAKLSNRSRFLALRVNEPITVKEKTVKAVVDVLAMGDSSLPGNTVTWHKTACSAIAYLEKDSLAQSIKYGDIMVADALLKEVASPQNPYQYDYQTYLARKGVYHQLYVRSQKWRTVSRGNVNAIFQASYAIRDRLLSLFENNGLSGREYAVISALLIGYTDKIDPELMKDYSGTGAIHILSVSGMHVGIVFVVMNLLLFFLDKNKYLLILKGLLLLAFVWFYAMITGLSPCILRAAATFSFIIIARVTRQRSNIYNTIAASILSLLIVDPYYLTDVGFQLSYLAVIGIVAIYEPIHNLWRPKYKLFEKIWALIAVSIAAQLATFPLAMLYFHQFPNYFLITNLVAVPISTLIIYFGMALIGLSFLPVIPVWLGKATSWLIWFMNTLLHRMEGMPYAVSRGLVINTGEMILLYAAIMLFFGWFMLKKTKMLKAALVILAAIALSFSWRNYRHQTQRAMVVYSISKSSGTDFMSGRNTWFLSDSLLAGDTPKQEFSIQGNRWHRGIAKTIPLINGDTGMQMDPSFYKRGNIICFGGKRIALLTTATSNQKKIALDYLLLAGRVDMTLPEILTQYTPGIIILHASVPAKRVAQMQAECTKAGIQCYSVTKSGAFVAEF